MVCSEIYFSKLFLSRCPPLVHRRRHYYNYGVMNPIKMICLHVFLLCSYLHVINRNCQTFISPSSTESLKHLVVFVWTESVKTLGTICLVFLSFEMFWKPPLLLSILKNESIAKLSWLEKIVTFHFKYLLITFTHKTYNI